MESFCLTAPALPIVFASLADETAYLLQFERPAGSPAPLVELDDEGDVVNGEASSSVELCLEDIPSPLYGGEAQPVPIAREIGSKKRRLSSFLILTRRMRSGAATRSEGGGGEKVRGAETEHGNRSG